MTGVLESAQAFSEFRVQRSEQRSEAGPLNFARNASDFAFPPGFNFQVVIVGEVFDPLQPCVLPLFFTDFAVFGFPVLVAALVIEVPLAFDVGVLEIVRSCGELAGAGFD